MVKRGISYNRLKKYLQKAHLDKVWGLRKDKRIARLIIVFLLTGFILLSAFAYFVPTTAIEVELSRELQDEQHPLLDPFMIAVSWFGNNTQAIACVGIASFLFLLFSYRREAIFIALTSLASVINSGIKIVINRPRPTTDVVEILVTMTNNSFPSGHVVHYVVFFGFLLILMYRLKKLNLFIRLFISLLSVILIFSVPFSRVYLGAHWFSDVLAGFFLGILLLSALLYFYFKKPGPQQGNI